MIEWEHWSQLDVYKHLIMLKNYEPNPSHVLDRQPIDYGKICNMSKDWLKLLRTKTIPLVRVFWQYNSIEEALTKKDQIFFIYDLLSFFYYLKDQKKKKKIMIINR